MPFYDKWYRFWLFWMGTDGIYEAMKADRLGRQPRAVSQLNDDMRTLFIELMKMQSPTARPGGEGDPHLSAGRQAHGARQRVAGALKRDNVDLVTGRSHRAGGRRHRRRRAAQRPTC